jgi:PIN domain nuclease of toxin-antitoxin system
MNLVLDTCGLLYWTLAPERLTPPTAAALEGLGPGDRVALCSISIWEVAVKHGAGRLDLGIPLDDYIRRVHRLPLEVVAPDAWLWIESVRLPWEHRDPADRLIVALARRRGATIVSTDRRVSEFHRDTIH